MLDECLRWNGALNLFINTFFGVFVPQVDGRRKLSEIKCDRYRSEVNKVRLKALRNSNESASAKKLSRKQRVSPRKAIRVRQCVWYRSISFFCVITSLALGRLSRAHFFSKNTDFFFGETRESGSDGEIFARHGYPSASMFMMVKINNRCGVWEKPPSRAIDCVRKMHQQSRKVK